MLQMLQSKAHHVAVEVFELGDRLDGANNIAINRLDSFYDNLVPPLLLGGHCRFKLIGLRLGSY